MTQAVVAQTRAGRRRALRRAARRKRATKAGTATAAGFAALGFLIPIAAPAQAAVVGTGPTASVLQDTPAQAPAVHGQAVDVSGAVRPGLDRATYTVAPRTIQAVAASLASAPQQVIVTGPVTPAVAQHIGEQLAAERGWAGAQFTCLVQLWTKESSWRVDAYNPSGAYGIPQSLPASKMASAGPDWRTDPATQIRWGLTYIASSYGTPCGAWAHEVAHNWY